MREYFYSKPITPFHHQFVLDKNNLLLINLLNIINAQKCLKDLTSNICFSTQGFRSTSKYYCSSWVCIISVVSKFEDNF